MPFPAGNHPLAILSDHDNVPYTLYPFVHLLPSGRLFIFAGQLSVVLDYTKNKVRRREDRGWREGVQTQERKEASRNCEA